MASKRGEEADRRALVVLGTHRSGTSAIARLLMLLGADSPKRLMPPDSSNEKGHWEPLRMTTLHDEICRSVSSRWDDLCPLPDSWGDSAAAREFHTRAVDVLREDYGDSPLFVVKDPRMCRTIPFWRSVFTEYGAEPSYVVVVRNPMEVSASLKARDGMNPARALLIYLRDTLAVERETRESPRLFITFEQTLDDWRSVTERISEELGVAWPGTAHRAAAEIERFLSPKHRHNVASGEHLAGRTDVVDWVKSMYAILQEAAESGSEPDRERLDEIHALYEQADLAFGPVLAEAELDAEAKGMRLHWVAAENKRLSIGLEVQRRSALGLGASVRQMESSRSWRITRPLRELGAGVRRLLRRPARQPGPPAVSQAAPPSAGAAAAWPGRGRPHPVRRGFGGAPMGLAGSGAFQQSMIEWIRHLESSRSWRITRPLRQLGARVRRLLHRPVVQPVPPAVSRAAPPPPAPTGPALGGKVRLPVSGASEQSLSEWIRHLESSRSWRITRPLRDVGAAVRRLVHRQVVQPVPPAVSTAAPSPTGAPFRVQAPPQASGDGRGFGGPPPKGLLAGIQGGPRVAHPLRGIGRPSSGQPAFPSLSSLSSAPTPVEPLVQGNAGELVEQIRASTTPAESFQEFDTEIAADRQRLAKLIAFYLPQFHSIPENDEWWGKGFTDWRNVVRGTPRFAGHYQPRIPRDLGFYDLSDPETIRRQVELARAAGLYGFAFYYFSFGGRRLLERPLEQFLTDHSIEFPFCLTWANENWTRRWDGLDEEALIRQGHDAGDDVALVDDVQRYFEDPRYIRIDGRPLFLVYRFDVLANPRTTVTRWREVWRERHDEDPLIFLVQSFEDDPRPYGADGAVEFPPQRLARLGGAISDEVQFFDPEFSGSVIDYESLANTAMQRQMPPYPWARGITPSWDNDARRQGAGTVLHGSTPELYERWLATTVDAAQQNPVLGEPLVFINAWNEWAEGAYLEPDVRYGGAYLNATARAVTSEKARHPAAPPAAEPRRREKTKVLLVGHDAHPHGAQMSLRGLGERLKDQFGCEVAYLLLEGGPLTIDYRRQGETHVCADPELIAPIARRLRKRGYAGAIVNTLASAEAVPPLKEAGFRVVSLVQELPGMIRARGLERAAETVAKQSNKVVFPAAVVAESFSDFARVSSERLAIKPQGLFRESSTGPAPSIDELRGKLGIPDGAAIVLNVGYADQRKGIDLFVSAAERAEADAPDLHFVWLGNLNAEALELRAEIASAGAENIHFADFTEDVSPYLALADVFFLSSREDPFPSVVLEAMDAGLPVVAFRDSGGSESLAAEHGALVDAEDLDDAVRVLRRCADEDDPAAAEARRRVVREEHQPDSWSFEILRLLDEDLKKVSVVVPNRNYADHLPERLESIFAQTYPIFELIVLDDGSTDSSLLRLEEIREQTGRRFRAVTNDERSGSVFKQWGQACELARGDYLWIAEADDACRSEFLERLMRQMHEGVAFTFSDSAQIDGAGVVLANSYQDYYSRSANGLMQSDFVLEGDQFVRSCLMERNLVLNVSSVVWNRECLERTLDRSLDELLGYQLAGDWHLYAATALAGKRVAFVSDPLNIHRRHENGVTESLDKQMHLEEVRRVHSRLSDWLPASEEDRDRMQNYEAELEEQFGLTS
jgi:glycosyltransferase involved in cell wall biosynthesis